MYYVLRHKHISLRLHAFKVCEFKRSWPCIIIKPIVRETWPTSPHPPFPPLPPPTPTPLDPLSIVLISSFWSTWTDLCPSVIIVWSGPIRTSSNPCNPKHPNTVISYGMLFIHWSYDLWPNFAYPLSQYLGSYHMQYSGSRVASTSTLTSWDVVR